MRKVLFMIVPLSVGAVGFSHEKPVHPMEAKVISQRDQSVKFFSRESNQETMAHDWAAYVSPALKREPRAAGVLLWPEGKEFEGGQWEIGGQTFPVRASSDPLDAGPRLVYVPAVYGTSSMRATLRERGGRHVITIRVPALQRSAPELKSASVQAYGKTFRFRPRPLLSPLFCPPIEVQVEGAKQGETFGISMGPGTDNYPTLLICDSGTSVWRAKAWTGSALTFSVGPLAVEDVKLNVTRCSLRPGLEEVKVNMADGKNVLWGQFTPAKPETRTGSNCAGYLSSSTMLAPQGIDLYFENVALRDHTLDPQLHVRPFGKEVEMLRDGQQIPAKTIRRKEDKTFTIDLGLPSPGTELKTNYFQ